MSVKWYCCKKCGTAIQKESTPNISGCPKGGSHQWNPLGEAGSTNYQCKKCGMMVQCKSTPNINGCTAASCHSWTKM